MAVDDIFRAYDVRGEVGADLDAETMRGIGQAFAVVADEQGYETVLVGMDVRTSSPELRDAFVAGATAGGIDVLDAGLAPYGAVLYASRDRRVPSAYVTASHLAREWNGIKFAHPSGVGFLAEENDRIKELFFDGAETSGVADREEVAILDEYRDHLLSRVDIDTCDVVLDCGNGASTAAAPEIFEAAGCETTVLHGEPDGTFPNRDSDVTEESLTALQDEMAESDHDIGIAYDGDADRVAVVDDTGTLLSAEQLSAILLQELLPAHDGPVIANVECSRLLEDTAKRYDRAVERVRVGHNYMIQALQDHGGCFAVETSRHMSVAHILPLDDGIAASLYAAEVVSTLDRPLSVAREEIPSYVRDRIAFEVPDSEKFDLIEALQTELADAYERTNTTDGIRVDLEHGWVLIRASNTSPLVRLTIEAEDREEFDILRQRFSQAIEKHL